MVLQCDRSFWTQAHNLIVLGYVIRDEAVRFLRLVRNRVDSWQVHSLFCSSKCVVGGLLFGADCG